MRESETVTTDLAVSIWICRSAQARQRSGARVPEDSDRGAGERELLWEGQAGPLCPEFVYTIHYLCSLYNF